MKPKSCNRKFEIKYKKSCKCRIRYLRKKQEIQYEILCSNFVSVGRNRKQVSFFAKGESMDWTRKSFFFLTTMFFCALSYGHHHFEFQIGNEANDTIKVIDNEEIGSVSNVQLGADFEACEDYIAANARSGACRPSPNGTIVHGIHQSPGPARHDSSFLSRRGFQSETAPNLIQVTDQIYRSGRPGNGDLAELKKDQGIRTVIDLEDSNQVIQQEEKEAEQLGLKFVTSPMSWAIRPKDAEVDQLLNILRDEKNLPILVHCRHGEDRTGLIIGLYRVEVQGWTPEAAYQEMLKLGFHRQLVNLDGYFRKRTGLH